MEKFSLWKLPVSIAFFFSLKEKNILSEFFSRRKFEIKLIFYWFFFQNCSVQYSCWKISQWINILDIKVTFYWSPKFPMRYHQLLIRNFLNHLHWGKGSRIEVVELFCLSVNRLEALNNYESLYNHLYLNTY